MKLNLESYMVDVILTGSSQVTKIAEHGERWNTKCCNNWVNRSTANRKENCGSLSL